jgi:hypothetical protein
MKMSLVPTADDCVWFGCGYIAAVAGASDGKESPFNEDDVPNWLTNSFKQGAFLGLRVKSGEIARPEFHDLDTDIAIVLVQSRLLRPSNLEELLVRWCIEQDFVPLPRRDGRFDAFRREAEEKQAMQGKSRGIPREMMELLNKIKKDLPPNIQAKIVHAESLQEVDDESDETDEDSEPPASQKKKFTLN